MILYSSIRLFYLLLTSFMMLFHHAFSSPFQFSSMPLLPFSSPSHYLHFTLLFSFSLLYSSLLCSSLLLSLSLSLSSDPFYSPFLICIHSLLFPPLLFSYLLFSSLLFASLPSPTLLLSSFLFPSLLFPPPLFFYLFFPSLVFSYSSLT